jgi:cytoskeletal protein CcmA (bactofilin family)
MVDLTENEAGAQITVTRGCFNGDEPVRSSSSISRITRISGKLELQGIARIEGEGEGEITGDDIEIAESAVVRASITANRLKVAGQVDGEIVARERIEVLPTARLQCTITTPMLIVTEGGQFNGDCKMPRECTSSSQSEPASTNDAGRSFIPKLHEARLHEKGHSDGQIAQVKPAEAHRILGIE